VHVAQVRLVVDHENLLGHDALEECKGDARPPPSHHRSDFTRAERAGRVALTWRCQNVV
jgi:hypothetical protein